MSDFFVIFALYRENITNREDMRKIMKYLLRLAAVAAFVVLSSGCIRQNYWFLEDGEFDGIEFSDYDLLHNAEVEQDDIDRN